VRRARRNPIGLPTPTAQLVRVGAGLHTHIYNPATGHTLCESGLGRSGGEQQLFKSEAGQATCYRCTKLGSMNMSAGRDPWCGPRG
jgi:hypothetical protein